MALALLIAALIARARIQPATAAAAHRRVQTATA
jgi:hypothetical protein